MQFDNKLETRIKQTVLQVYADLGADVQVDASGRRYGFVDNGANVLAVVHLDYVGMGLKGWHARYRDIGGTVVSPALDDRLGLWIIADLLPKYGANFDILLTEDEEVGASTAGLFVTEKSYNWIFSFDRRGTDVVMYDYETRELKTLLEAYGFTVGLGSFSDICYLEHLGCSGFNFGAGYYMEHSKDCFALAENVAEMVARFMRFYNDNANIPMVYTSRQKTRRTWGLTADTGDDDAYFLCEYCGYEYARLYDSSLSNSNGLCLYCEQGMNWDRWESEKPDSMGDDDYGRWLAQMNQRLLDMAGRGISSYSVDYLRLYLTHYTDDQMDSLAFDIATGRVGRGEKADGTAGLLAPHSVGGVGAR